MVPARTTIPSFPFLVLTVAIAAASLGFGRCAMAFVAIRTNSIGVRHLGITPGETATGRARFLCRNGAAQQQQQQQQRGRDTGNGSGGRRRCQSRRDTLLAAAAPNVGYEYIPPKPDASPGSFHMSGLRSSYPPGTPAGLRGEAVRSALVTTERCLGWNLSGDRETSLGGVLEVSGRGTLDFLNGKLSRDFRSGGVGGGRNGMSSYREACLLDAKGRIIDVLRVTLDDDKRRALVLTSPGHSSTDLLKRLDPFVFPMDEVELTDYCIGDHQSFAFTLASTQYQHVRKAMREQSNLPLGSDELVFPGASEAAVWKPRVDNDDGGGVEILVVPSTGIAPAACVGYNFVFFGPGPTAAAMGRDLWEHLVGEDNPEGPVEVGALEYETLRVEAGQPAYGHEYGIGLAAQRRKERGSEEPEPVESGPQKTSKRKKKKSGDLIKTGPFELHLDPLIDLDKGCYVGQEGIASVLRNPRGSPRNLYAVVFEDDFNIYESQSRGDKSDFDNLTTLPRPGQTLCALGSNEALKVGTLTSMGEAGGTGSRHTVGLALVKRPDGILKRMEELDLEIPRPADDFLDVDPSTGSGIMQPPPLDPLDGLEIIVEGTFTMGVLRSIPARRSGARDSNMFDPDIEVEGIDDRDSATAPPPVSAAPAVVVPEADSLIDMLDDGTETDDGDDEDNLLSDLKAMEAEVARATAEADAAAAEAKRKTEKMELLKQRAAEAMARRKEKADAAAEEQRKAEKMELLKKRAEEAMARRKQKAAPKAEIETITETAEDPAAAEALRKAEKMEMLKKRAEEAMARRKANKEQQS